MTETCSKSALLDSLPAPWPDDLQPSINAGVASASDHKLVVLDDDPTGTQTVYDVPVLTEWSVDSLGGEFMNDLPCLYILTNSRSLAAEAARALTREIARNLVAAAGSTSRFTVVSRSDSTLRGHFPAETDILEQELGPFDATILIPFFEAGERYTINDTHYVGDGDRLFPGNVGGSNALADIYDLFNHPN
ncbi:MAG TPA: hypothetical protein EYG57_17415 [Planctomycetes bacterium]|nr:hypothetical protein [Verrucomicrobiales bacterium]HIM31310.1 hypothetical protein [Planctomycetota bacterium]